PDLNIRAIDTQVDVLAARSADGIYVSEQNALLIDSTGPIAVKQVNLNSTLTTRTDDSLSDLRTTDAAGHIKLVTLDATNGSITINDGIIADGLGIQAAGINADILVRAATDLIVNAAIVSNNGNISLIAGDDLDLNDDVFTGGGDIYLFAANAAADALLGIDMQTGISVQSAGGDIRLAVDNEGDLLLTSLDAGSGDISLLAEGSILDNTPSSSLAAFALAGQNQVVVSNVAGFQIGDTVVLQDSNDFVPAEQHTITAIAGNTLTLSGNLANPFANNAVVNIRNVRADALLMWADAVINSDGSLNTGAAGNQSGSIGLHDMSNALGHINSNAIATEVASLAARSADGIYVAERNDIQVDTVSVDTQQVRFNSTLSNTGDTLSDLTTTDSNSPIKLASLSGSLRVLDGLPTNDFGVQTFGANSDILLSAAVDLDIQADIISNGGHISLLAQQTVNINGEIDTTMGSGTLWVRSSNGSVIIGEEVTSHGGDILIDSGEDVFVNAAINSDSASVGIQAARDVLQNANITASSGIFVDAGQTIIMAPPVQSTAGMIVYQAGGFIQLALLNAAQNAGIQAGLDIVDNNGSALNINAENASLRAGGRIGVQDPGSTPLSNLQAIDTQVTTLAADGSNGIYLQQQSRDVSVDHVPLLAVSVAVQQVYLNSTTETAVASAAVNELSDLTTTDSTVELINQGGSIQLTDGEDGDRFAIQAGNGDVQLASQTHIYSNSDELLTSLSSAGFVGQTEVTVADASEIMVGDEIILSSGETHQALIVTSISGNTLTLDSALTSEFPATANVYVNTAQVQGDHLRIYAANYVHLPNTRVNTLEAILFDAQNAVSEAGTLFYNQAADAQGQAVLDELEHSGVRRGTADGRPDPGMLDPLRDAFSFRNRFGDSYALLVRNAGDLTVNHQDFGQSLFISGVQPSVYLETTADGQLTVDGANALISSTSEDPGIVLISDDQLNLPGQIETFSSLGADFNQEINTLDLNALAFNGGENQLTPPVSTRVVLINVTAVENLTSHVLQRVSMHFGSANEAGFMTMVHYADGRLLDFDDISQVAAVAGNNFTLVDPMQDPGAIQAANADPQLFARDIPFTDLFLNSNQLLPTEVIIRRSLDFFLFSTDASGQLVDEASYKQEVEGVFSDGSAAVVIVPDPDPMPPPMPVFPIVIVDNVVPLPFVTPSIDLPVLTSGEIQVAIYPIEYDDINEDGQVDSNELPTYAEVLQEELSDESKRESITIEPSQGGEEPTPDDIEKKKAELLNDPSQPSGAYAIIKTDADGNRIVLDVFFLRNSSEDMQQQSTDEAMDTPQLPRLEPFQPQEFLRPQQPNSGSSNEGPSSTEDLLVPPPVEPPAPSNTDQSMRMQIDPVPEPSTKWAASGLLLGTLSILKRTNLRSGDASNPQSSLIPTNVDFGRHARLRRSSK
ncbi:MAG: hypothetical protein NXI32_22245, partial [bacterium]|nr:hypothetical protein [bacterium]